MKLAELHERGGQQAADGGGERGDGELADHRALVCLQVGLRAFDQGEDAVGVGDQELGGVGQADAAAVALEELLAGLAFQLGQLLGDR